MDRLFETGVPCGTSLTAPRQNAEEILSDDFILKSIDAAMDAAIIEKARRDREEEYREVFEQCEAFQSELEEASKNRLLTFIELEDMEQKLYRLKHWISKINKRDIVKDSPLDQELGKSSRLAASCSRHLPFRSMSRKAFKSKIRE